jgi:uncharacterized membrane protein SpoIIM required for sporulation
MISQQEEVRMAVILMTFLVMMVVLSPVFLGLGLIAFVNTRIARKMDPAGRAKWRAEVNASTAKLNAQRVANQSNPYSGW